MYIRFFIQPRYFSHNLFNLKAKDELFANTRKNCPLTAHDRIDNKFVLDSRLEGANHYYIPSISQI